MDFEATAASAPVAQARFTCSRHGGEAGRVRLHRASDGSGWLVVVESFLSLMARVDAETGELLLRELPHAAAAWLHQADREYTPFYCPTCDAVYCRECWRTWNVFDDEFPGWFEETRGVCPEGHERMLMD